MRQRLPLVALAVSVLLTACDAPNFAAPSDPSASGLALRFAAVKSHSDTKDQPWVFDEIHPCNSDEITGAGLLDTRFDSSIDTNGATNINIDMHADGVGSGSISNKTYKVNLHSTYQSKTSPDPSPAFSIKQQDTWTVTGPTTADNYKRVTTFQLVVDDHGVTKTNIDKTTYTCGK
jgi:hypothetical protein